MEPNSQESRQLIAFIERIESVMEEEKGLREAKKDIYSEAKGTGFIVAPMKALVRLRAMDKEKRMEEETLLDLYKSAVGLSE